MLTKKDLKIVFILFFFTVWIVIHLAPEVLAVSIVDSYSESNQNASSNIFNGSGVVGAAQSFTASSTTLDSIKFYVKKTGSPPNTMVAKIYSHSGTYGTSSQGNAVLATSDTVSTNILTTSFALITFSFSGAERISLTNGTYYVASLEYTSGDSSNYIVYGHDDTSPTHSGNRSRFTGSSWLTSSGEDMVFYVYGASYPYVSSVNDLPDPIVPGNEITFSTTWATTTSDTSVGLKSKICKTDALSNQNCTGGAWASSTSFSLGVNPLVTTYITQAADIGTKNYYAFVCDTESECSATSTTGTFFVNYMRERIQGGGVFFGGIIFK